MLSTAYVYLQGNYQLSALVSFSVSASALSCLTKTEGELFLRSQGQIAQINLWKQSDINHRKATVCNFTEPEGKANVKRLFFESGPIIAFFNMVIIKDIYAIIPLLAIFSISWKLKSIHSTEIIIGFTIRD